MADIVDRATRSRMMSGIRGTDTKPEKMVRSLLHRQGFRFRLNVAGLPGRPDLVLPKHRAVLFVHGCFFHGHQCRSFRWPKANAAFWKAKIQSNMARDRKVAGQLESVGWRVGIVWECSLRGNHAVPTSLLARLLGSWLRSSRRNLVIEERARE